MRSSFLNNIRNSYFSNITKKITVISIALIIVISYSLFFYLQNNTESSVEGSLFEQQQQRQIESTKALSEHISSDLDSVMARLQVLASSTHLQQGDLYSNKTRKFLQEIYPQLNNISMADRLFIVDKNNIITINNVPKGQQTLVGTDYSFRDWIRNTKSSLMPVFSDGYEGRDGKYRIAITYPIINRETGKYIGLVGTSIPTIEFFEHYGNIYNIKSQYLAVLDRNSVQLIHPVKSFVGTPFFGNHTQQATGHNAILNNLIRAVMAGKPASGVYEFINGQRLNTGYPIFVQGKPTYSIFEITPTATIYSQINNVIATERTEMLTLLAGATAAIIGLVIFLIKWNSTLDNEVKRRTKDLNESNQQLQLTTSELTKANASLAESNEQLTSLNKQLAEANEQLKIHDKMQKEFINVAAHELRTPIQPILSLTQILRSNTNDVKQHELLDVTIANAKRLQRLSDNILDATRIESQSLKLDKEQVNLNDVITEALDSIGTNREFKGETNLKFKYQPRDIFVEADRSRITQVMTNLLNNAVKFIKEDGSSGGTITITIEKKGNGQKATVVVTVKDTGTGIDPGILPRLFGKFTSKSYQGTGLGLFISKSIVEAHGGRIWAENNSNGEKGATFYFSLPVSR
jgi:signal transduction histidine kinase